MSDKQKSLKESVSIKGKGLHTGQECTITFKPAEADFGYKFQRIDLDEKPLIKAIVENVIDTSRGTTIEEHGARVYTVEHALSALFGLGIDNALIEIDGEEVPIIDGSAYPFAKMFKEVGIIDLEKDKNYFEITSSISLVNNEDGIEYVAVQNDKYCLNVLLDYKSAVMTNQYASINHMEEYYDTICKSRTFVFLHELEMLVKHGLVKGGDVNNAIVLVDQKVERKTLDELSTFFGQPKLDVIPEKGVLNNLELHYSNEPARHKLLDVIGDLALIGVPIKGRIIARKPGHASNVEFARKIKQVIKKERSGNMPPKVDLNAEPLMDINKIKTLLPHRQPFLLVDKVMQMSSTEIITVKNVTMNEPFFVGHFPQEPVMPGVLIIEAMAQAGGILVLNSVDNPEEYSTYFMKIDAAKFKRKVVPGDTIIFRLKIIGPIRRGIAVMKAQAFVGDKIVSEAELMAQIAKNK